MPRAENDDRGIMERPAGSGRWWVRVWHQGREHRFGLFPDRTTARIFYRRVKQEQREERFEPERYHKRRRGLTVGQWIEAYLEGCTLQTRKDHERFGRLWRELIGARTLDQVTTSELAGIQARMKAGGEITPATINRRFSFLRRIYTLAVRDGRATKNPVSGIRFFQEPRGRTRYLTEGEEKRLSEVMAPADFALVRFAINTGLRQAEQFSLRWEHVDKARRVLTVPRSKSGQTRHVPLNDAALAVLDSLQSWMTSPWVFPGRIPGRPRHATAFYHRIYQSALKRAGIEGATWHTLRHTFASRLVMAGVDLRTVQELLGHKSLEMTVRYSHLSPGHLHQAVQSLDPVKDRPS